MQAMAIICRGSDNRHWGLTPGERLRRLLENAGVGVVERNSPKITDDAQVVVVNADYLFDDRIVGELSVCKALQLRQSERADSRIVALKASGSVAREAARKIEEGATEFEIEGLPVRSPVSLLEGAPNPLLKAQHPFVVLVSRDRKDEHERLLYDASYKGVTDLVTKWIWPTPARWTVKACVRLSLRPNHVTMSGFVLMLAALFLFWRGDLAIGLIPAWIMTFFDTVDGKLARTTVTSSKIGHWCDKLMDIIHPPFWYIAWGMGLASYASPTPSISLATTLWILTGGYVVGRLVELVGSERLVKGGLFVWRPLDSFFRLVTARRNTCLLLMSLFLAVGRPDSGLWAVMVWTVATTVFLAGRTVVAWREKGGGEPLRSWLIDADPLAASSSRAVRWFTQPLGG